MVFSWDSSSDSGPDVYFPDSDSDSDSDNDSATSNVTTGAAPNTTTDTTPDVATGTALDTATGTVSDTATGVTSNTATSADSAGKHQIGPRIQALTMLQIGIPIRQITALTNLSKSTIHRHHNKAIIRGYNPKVSMLIHVSYVEDAKRSGRPKTSQAVIDLVLATVTKNSTTRSYSAKRIAQKVSAMPEIRKISASTVYRILIDNNYKSCKQTVKPGLSIDMQKKRLTWCLLYKDWTLEDWKNVIFTDETSVQMGGVRGKRRVWRTPEEAYHKHIIKRRYKGFKEFMFWAAFSYDKKGPCHIWDDETPEEKLACKIDLDTRNAARLDDDKAMWELNSGVERVGLRNKPGRKPKFTHTEATGAYIRRKGAGGIDWYRYQTVILKKLLLPFAKECMVDRPGTLVQEDGAGAHASHYQQEVFDLWAVLRLLWPGNSPDLNAIEPTWNYMKRKTTENGGPGGKAEMKKDWLECWKDMPQEKIQEWIERIPVHIQEVIALNCGNEYKEGRCRGQLKKRVH